MKLVIASSNEHKIEEFNSLLYPYKVYSPSDLGLSFEYVEDGKTFMENAGIKARALYDAVVEKNLEDIAVLADDSGLNVDALPGELGIRTARYGCTEEKTLTSEEKYMLLLNTMKDVPEERRTAYFSCSLCFIYNKDGEKKIIEANGKCTGRILTEPKGDNGFGYDPVFFCEKAGKPMAELGQEKNKYSHRGLAVKELLRKITKEGIELEKTDLSPQAVMKAGRKMSKKADFIPLRNDIPEADKWNLGSLYTSEKAYTEDLMSFKSRILEAEDYRGTLGNGPKELLKALTFMSEISEQAERLYVYASLRYAAEAEDTQNQVRLGKISSLYTRAMEALSFMDPEILKIKDLENIIKDRKFRDFRVYLNKLIRQKKYTLSNKEERILAMQNELSSGSSSVFNVLTNVDMDFGKINGKPLTQSTYPSFLIDKNRDVRKEAYNTFYDVFNSHKQTLATLYINSIKQDVYSARVRGFKTALEAQLYKDAVPQSVYTGLIDAVHTGLSTLHSYYSLKRQMLNLDQLCHYAVYVPIVSTPRRVIPYDEAVKIVRLALSPLGKEYTSILYKGLTSARWVDKYENKSKRSGAFSSGAYSGKPYILMNYKEDVIGDVFTLAHEAGHSMHSYYSKENNPFMCYQYTIFEAEVSSTFNEQLMARYFLDNAETRMFKVFILSKLLDDMVGTLFRQTMFAEYELKCHTLYENDEPLTLQTLRQIYRELLVQYFGSEMHFEENSDLEGLRIPHFYNAYYVYKYATGISASIALSERVLNGGKKELDDYLGFLKSGGSLFPIDSLKKAGVDMSTQEPVLYAVKHFASLLDELKKILRIK